MRASIKIGGGLTLAALCIFAASFAAGIYTANNVLPESVNKAGPKWVEAAAPSNRLPGVSAPDDRNDPQLEADTARLCSQYAVFSGKMLFSARSKGMTRLQMQAELADDKSQLASKITRHVMDIIYGNEYSFSSTELSNYTYQYCDLVMHTFVKNASQTGGNDTSSLK